MTRDPRSIPLNAIAAVFCFCLAVFSLETLAEEDDAAGQEAFEAAKCHVCHSVATVGITRTTKSKKMAGPDLSGIGNVREPEWLTDYIKREATTEQGEKHTKPFKGSDEELQTIVDWMMTLVDEAPTDESADS